MSISVQQSRQPSHWCQALQLAPGQAGQQPPRIDSVSTSTVDHLQSHADMLIVGGGLTGLSAAYHVLVARPGGRVVVLESQHIGFGASSRNSGMLTPGIGQNLASLVSRYGAEQAREMYLTSLRAVEYVGEICRRERMEIGLRMTGQLIIARGQAGRQRLTDQARLFQSLDLPCRQLNDADLARRLCISLDAPGLGPAALQLPIAGVLDPGRLVREMAAAVKCRGGIIVENSPVARISTTGVELQGGKAFQADKVVIATNAYDVSLGRQQGRLIPLHLQMILTRPLTVAERERLGWRHREGIIDSRRVFNYFRLTDDHRLLLGGGLPQYYWQGQVHDAPAAAPGVARLQTDLGQLFPQLAAIDIERSWTGAIAYSMDTLPVVGQVSNHPQAIHVGGWCGHGIALSVYSGRWIADMLSARAGDEKHNASQPWFRSNAPRFPTEIARWCGVRLGGWATQILDRFV